MTLPASTGPFLKSVVAGAIAGTAPVVVMIGTMILGSLLQNGATSADLLYAAVLLLLPVACAALVTAFFALTIGVPLTAFLARRGRESARIYVLAGAVAGGTIGLVYDLVISATPVLIILPLMGAVSGAVTAWTWWRTARRHPALFEHKGTLL